MQVALEVIPLQIQLTEAHLCLVNLLQTASPRKDRHGEREGNGGIGVPEVVLKLEVVVHRTPIVGTAQRERRQVV
ncbi:hypothetical protein Barb7_00835 [Bacteroidales bacterium Barb7]|nr:hypothetical protein Barb7_00835 [Bacteroidales bacterium Barb7]